MNYDFLKKILFKFEPEMAHFLAEAALRGVDFIAPSLMNIFAKDYIVANTALRQELLGLKFPNPVGLAGGYDKNASMLRPLAALGFGFLEFGTFTPKAQKGNEKPRLFRYAELESVQNAMGFNNLGAQKIAANVRKIYPFILPLGANIGKNKLTENKDALNDYISLLKDFNELCDYYIINISSPNTKDLRTLQDAKFVGDLMKEAKKLTQKPIFVKIAPDMDEKSAISLCKAAAKCGVKGFIIANTSVDYSLIPNARSFGGISGKALQSKAGAFFKAVAREIYGEAILIASGGIDSAAVAYERVKDGANLVQVFTGLIFKGPALIKDINLGLLKLMQKDGFSHISEAVGANLRGNSRVKKITNLAKNSRVKKAEIQGENLAEIPAKKAKISRTKKAINSSTNSSKNSPKNSTKKAEKK